MEILSNILRPLILIYLIYSLSFLYGLLSYILLDHALGLLISYIFELRRLPYGISVALKQGQANVLFYAVTTKMLSLGSLKSQLKRNHTYHMKDFRSTVKTILGSYYLKEERGDALKLLLKKSLIEVDD